jgi:hypothetical protein
MEFDTLTLTHKERVFVIQYFETALWADHADGLELDEIDEDCLREGTLDALCFFSRAWAYLSDDNYTDAAHTFYLVRQGHGVAFSDHPETFSDFDAHYLEKLASGFAPVDYFTTDGTMFYDIGMSEA